MKKIRLLLIPALIIGMMFPYSCVKKEIITLPKITTIEVDSITENSAVSGGYITNDGGMPVIMKGVCWNTEPFPTTNDSKTVNGSGAGIFMTKITGLLPDNTYFVRAYAINEIGISFGTQYMFKTITNLPTVGVEGITNISKHSAIVSGILINIGTVSSVTQHGHCWSSTNINPDTSLSTKTELGKISTTYIFNDTLTNLDSATIYIVRSYAINDYGISYSDGAYFRTLNVPTTVTMKVVNIIGTSADCGGEVTDNGGSAVIERGVCWSNTQNPTINDNHTTDGSGNGVFSSSLTHLSSDVKYFVRAYAINKVGPGYGNEHSFTSYEFCPGTPIVEDSEGNIYGTRVIGGQCWMTENLRTGVMLSDENTEPTDNNIIEKWCYSNNNANQCDFYGGLYNWEEMMQYSQSDSGLIGTTQGICPDNWHIPSNEEIQNLKINHVGNVYSGCRIYHAYNASFDYLGDSIFIWSSTELDIDTQKSWYINSDISDPYINNGYSSKKHGYSVRCVKNE